MNPEHMNEIKKGKKVLSESNIIVCSIVRDCGRGLKRNIPIIDSICDLSNSYQVIIFENDSVDKTKSRLENWAKERKNISVLSESYKTQTIPSKEKNNLVNPYYSEARISKMALYRNKYLSYIKENKLEADYVIIVDLDVFHISLNGILSSFGVNNDWDVITANGISRSFSSKFRRRYHDAYALTECGLENIPQTEKTINENRYKWAFLKNGMPLIPVTSAFGGLGIYKKKAIEGCRYGVILNADQRVECKTEHFYLYNEMKQKGYNKIFINPSMHVKYQTQFRNTIIRFLKQFKNKSPNI